MVTRTRLAALLALTAVGLGGLVASAAVAPGDRVPTAVERVHRYYVVGPAAEYGGDFGVISSVRPLRWQVPPDGDRTAVVEVSFEYRTRGPGPFNIRVRVTDPTIDPGDDGTDGDATVRPHRFELAPAPRRTATTLHFLAPLLTAGTTYEAHVGVNSASPDGSGSNVIRTRKVLVTVELGKR